MSKYAERIQEILKNASSKKVMDKKKCILELLDLYDNADAIKEICKNTENNVQGIVNWSYLLHSVHKIVLNEADRFSVKSSYSKAIVSERQNTCSVVLKTVQHANSYKVPLLKCSDLMPLIFQILEANIYEPYHDTYMAILVTYVLPIRKYQVNMSPEQWKELLKVCINLYKNGPPDLNKRGILDALQMIVDYGSLHSELFLDIKKMLPFLEQVFMDMRMNQEILAKSTYTLANIICQRIIVESRIALCKFSETVLPNAISLNGSVEKYKLLLLFVQIHHPKGISTACNGAYAYNWTQWNAILKSIYLMILKDCKPDILAKSFIQLASEVFKQIIENPDIILEVKHSNELAYAQPAKRRRISADMTFPFDLIATENPDEAWPIIQILTALLEKYPECAKSQDVSEVLKILVNLLQKSCKQEIIMDNLYEIIAILMKNEKFLCTADTEKSKMYWDKIWDILLRSLNMNQNETSGHALAQLFIINNKTMNPNALLKLYLTNVIRWSTMSIHTLALLCEYVPLPNDTSVLNTNSSSPLTDSHSVKLCLLKWILNIPWQKLFTQTFIEELCSLLVSITLRSKYKKDNKHEKSGNSRTCHCLQKESMLDTSKLISNEYIEHCHLSLAYKTNFFHKEKNENSESEEKTNDDILYTQELLSYLVNNLCAVTKESNGDDDLSAIIFKIAIVAKVASLLKQLNLISGDIEDSPLVDRMKENLKSASTLLANIMPLRSKYVYLLNITTALNVLYEVSYDTAITKIIISSSTLDMLKNIFSLMNIEDNEVVDYRTTNDYYDDYSAFQGRHRRSDRERESKNQCSFCDGGTIRILATKALTLFCCMDTGETKPDIQTSLLKNLLTIDMYDLVGTVDLRMAVIVMESLMLYGSQKLWKNHKEAPIEFLLELYRQCHTDETAIRYILNILPYYFQYAIEFNCQPKNIISILSKIHAHLSKKKHGFIVRIQFIKCLTKVSYIGTSLSSCSLHNTLIEDLSIMETVLPYLVSPLCIIRLSAVQCIQEMYSLKETDFKWKVTFFDRIEQAVTKLFVVDRQIEEYEKADERETRVATALLTLTGVIYTNGTLQCRALLTMLRLSSDKQIQIEMVQKALRTIQDRISYTSLIEDNLCYLLSHWLNSKYSQKPFPWRLLECESQDHFNTKYIDMLVSIKLQNLNIPDAMALCENANVPFERIVENVFPQFISWLLYCMCENTETSIKKLATKTFHALLSNKDEFVTVRNFSDLFNDKFEDIVLYLILRLNDEQYLEEILNVQTSLPKSNFPDFKKASIDKCFTYMEKYLFAQGSSVQCILANNFPNTLQKILLCLICNVYKAQFLEHKLIAFHQYIYFTEMIVEKLEEDYFAPLSMYLVKEMGSSLLHLININDDALSELACKYYYNFVKSILPAKSKEMKEILNFSVMTLVSVVQEKRLPIALGILKFLIIEQKDKLQDAIEKLNSFPNTPEFEEIRAVHHSLKYKAEKVYSLEKEIEHFLNAVIEKNVSCSVEDISHLRLQIATRKEELKEMYSKLEKLRGFSEDCALSMLHQLIYRLVKLATSSDTKISIEAVKCLGELGPADLSTMILYLGKSHIKETSELVEILTYKIVTLLTTFLFQSDIELRKESANALYIVLASHWGQKISNDKYMKHIESVLNEKQLCFSYIQPFLADQELRPKQISLNAKSIRSIMSPNNTLWTVKSNGLYSVWITEITSSIANCFSEFFCESLIPVCKLSIYFCELVLPRIIFLIIHIDKKLAPIIFSCINCFFEFHFNPAIEVDESFSYTPPKSTSCDRQIVRCMLDIVNYIRIQVADNMSLELNYMCIAKAAQYCSAFFTAILYAEISCESILPPSYDCSTPKIDYIYELNPEKGKVIQNILRDTYLKIGDPDAIYGSGSSHLENHFSRVQHYIHAHKWEKVILAQDVELSFGNTGVIREMANGLYQSGLQYLLGQFISTISKTGEQIDDDIQYECAWRLSNWDLCEKNNALHVQTNYDTESEITDINYEFYHYQALKCFHNSNESGVQSAIENARISIIKALKNISLESSKTVYEKLTQLQMIREIEELSFAKQDDYGRILKKWGEHDITDSNEFQYVEPILMQRTVMYQIKNALSNHSIIKEELVHTYLKIAKFAVSQGHLQIAARALAVLEKRQDLPTKMQDQLLYQESLLAWLRNDLETGRYLLRSLINKDSLEPSLTAQVLRVYGDWMAETKSENPQAVIKKYYMESIKKSSSIIEQSKDVIKNFQNTRVALARFADAQFEQISSYMKSPQFESFQECVKYSCQGMSIDGTSKDNDLRKAVIISQKQNTNDVAELHHIEKEKNNYLMLALRHYLTILQQSEEYNLLIFRVIALWLDNTQHEELNELLSTGLDIIPSFKFIPLIPQLAAHMSNTSDTFSEKIYKIMKRCALDHPYHTLPVLLALKNLNGDYEYNNTIKNKKLKEEPRVLGARKLLEDLSRSSIRNILHKMDKLSHALVSLAYLESPPSKSGSIVKIPKNQEILKIKNFNDVSIPTATVHVQSSGNYSHIIGISKYVDSYETVGGVNAPKKITCIGTDGLCRHQLVKGKDDLRQDAVMQQVFNVMNTLLRTCKETNRRKLMIRTYKVVPLTQRSGILEWCDNTMPIAMTLVGSNTVSGLHKKYYPKDLGPNDCREMMARVVKASNDVKLKVFMDCCARMHPVLHHFFTEKYPSPETWFERRLAYTRSIATTSMAGYILGLGDRHLSNILIDQTTAEVIHIDFGIAFEQGKVLPIPETVPFRLTRNIEIAMGVSGIEGTMRRCCEKTLTVLRDQKQIIITLLQVLLYDPLFTWAITPARACSIQSGISAGDTDINQGFTKTNKTAKRALLRIEQKLQGTEEGLASSVSGQVERLIQQARDPSNLCRLYYGWQPYL